MKKNANIYFQAIPGSDSRIWVSELQRASSSVVLGDDGHTRIDNGPCNCYGDIGLGGSGASLVPERK